METNYDGVDTGQSDISVNVEHGPQPDVSSSCPVQLVESDVGHQGGSYQKERIHTGVGIQNDYHGWGGEDSVGRGHVKNVVEENVGVDRKKKLE